MALICIIDDDPVIRDSIGAMLDCSGYEVAAFESAEAFLAYDLIDQASCALVDVRMPGLDGIGLLKPLEGARLSLAGGGHDRPGRCRGCRCRDEGGGRRFYRKALHRR